MRVTDPEAFGGVVAGLVKDKERNGFFLSLFFF